MRITLPVLILDHMGETLVDLMVFIGALVIFVSFLSVAHCLHASQLQGGSRLAKL